MSVLRGILQKIHTSNPRIIFVTDAAGALLSTILLVVLALGFPQYIGLPQTLLLNLATLTTAYTLYSAGCYVFSGSQWPGFLVGIIIANCLYCAVTLLSVYLHGNTITPFGLFYFMGEVAIILLLVLFEIQVWRTRRLYL